MNKKLLKKFSTIVSKKLGKPVKFVSVTPAGSGYHSDGYRLRTQNGKEYFLKEVRSQDLGFEFPERKIQSLLVSTHMGQRSETISRPIGVIVVNGGEGAMLHKIDENTKIYHLQKYAGTGTSYSEILKKNEGKSAPDEEDRSQLVSIAKELARIHAVKHPSADPKKLRAVYDDGLRSVLSNPELTLMVLSEFPPDHHVLDLEGQKEMICLMYENIKTMMGHHKRLTALHGDFWGANIFFREDGSVFVVDYSRIPWGDPGIDVGWFMAEYLWLYHSTGNKYYRHMADLWLKIYSEVSGDKDISRHVALSIGWTGIIQVYPRWFPNVEKEVGKKFIAHIKKILRHKKFVWDN